MRRATARTVCSGAQSGGRRFAISPCAYVTKRFRATAEERDVWIDTLAVERGHIHVFLEFPPKCAIARGVGVLKGISAGRAFDRFPELRRKAWSGELSEDGHAAHTGATV